MSLSHSILARRAMLLAALVGLFASVYLLITYVSGGPIVCGTVQGCEIVRASKWAYSFGVPRPLLGVVFYVGVMILLAIRTVHPSWQPRWMYRLTILAAAIGFIESAFLTFVQWLDIKAFCSWCLTSAAAATIIAIAVWWDRSEVMEHHAALRELKFMFWSFILAFVLGGIGLTILIGAHTNGEIPRLEQG